MIEWFTKNAPIRAKLLFAFSSMTALVAICAAITLLASRPVAFGAQLALLAVAGLAGLAFRSGIAGPYVSTVVRMEALATGDLTSPIQYTDHGDCVGRMTKAMFKFRDDAQAQIALHEQAESVVRSTAAGLSDLADGNLTAEITDKFPPAYDPAKAQFTTFVNWQIRGELQGLRFRLMVDQRPSARKVAATTVSMNGITSNVDGQEMTLESIIEDEGALERTEAAASDYLARSATVALLDAFVTNERASAIEQLRRRPSPKRLPSDPTARALLAQRRLQSHGLDPQEIATLDQRLSHDRTVVEGRMFDTEAGGQAEDSKLSKDRVRTIAKRASVAFAHLAQNDPRFALMAR